MVEMSPTVLSTSHGAKFDAFLYAPIGEERNGMMLSVLSALARLDLDPWQEAAKLAVLPADTAKQRLTSLLEALPDATSPGRDPAPIAARLIGLLPHSAGHDKLANTVVGASAKTKPQEVLIWAVFMMVFLVSQWIAAGYKPSASADNVSAPISSPAAPKAQQKFNNGDMMNDEQLKPNTIVPPLG
jgi:hypothetical protein